MMDRFVHSPLLDKCLSPVTVFRDGKMDRFPCGKCAACLLSKANSWMFRLSDEINNHPFSLWFTLTYSNEFVPKLKPVYRDWIGRWFYCSDHPDNVRHDSVKVVPRTDGIVIDSFKLKVFPLQNYEFKDFIGYLSKRDIQLFLKLLRKKIQKIWRSIKLTKAKKS